MWSYWLKFELLSDTLFGRGDGVAGLVNTEVQHDQHGLPYLGGKTLKGMLGAMCAEILFALDRAQPQHNWRKNGQRLFGDSGSNRRGAAILHVGNAQLPEDLRQTIADEIKYSSLSRLDVLETLTALRRQTAMEATTGAPKKDTLRTLRVIQRGLPFIARLDFEEEPDPQDLALLAASIKALRRVGSNRNRGLGRIKAELYEVYPGDTTVAAQTDHYFKLFAEAMV